MAAKTMTDADRLADLNARIRSLQAEQQSLSATFADGAASYDYDAQIDTVRRARELPIELAALLGQRANLTKTMAEAELDRLAGELTTARAAIAPAEAAVKDAQRALHDARTALYRVQSRQSMLLGTVRKAEADAAAAVNASLGAGRAAVAA